MDKNEELKQKFMTEKSTEEVKEKVKLDMDELDKVSGSNKVRDWWKDGCAATCEDGSRCWSNDKCSWGEYEYIDFHEYCIDGGPHDWVYQGYTTAHGSGSGIVNQHFKCKKCGRETMRSS